MSLLYLKVLEWRQEIDCYPSINVEGLKLKAHCAPSNSQLELRDRGDLGNFAPLLLDLFDEKLKPDDERLPPKATGLIAYSGLVHGWFYLNSSSFAAAWDQVRDGGYVDCNISLVVDPVQYDGANFFWDVKSNSSIFIKSAGLQFTRKPIDKPAPRKGWFTRREGRR